jgi:hypothetical protein
MYTYRIAPGAGLMCRFDLGLARDFALLYKVLIKFARRVIAATELLLVFPASLFMTALFVRNLQPLQYEPARSAQRIVD